MTTQVEIPGVGRVDLLVGDRLVIEADSREFHLSKYQEDRTRDRKLIALGYIVVRLTYEDIVLSWNEVIADILTIIRRDDHLGRNGVAL